MRPGPVRHRAEFAALRARGVRSRRRAVRVTYLATSDEVRVAYAIGRPAGSAVRRNRLRRRLRVIVATLDLAPGRYLIAGGPEAVDLPFDVLEAQVRAGIGEVLAR